MNSKVCLVILDGWGIGRKDDTNPIWMAGTPYLDYLKQNYPYCALQASGMANGLPWYKEGNSEVGHLILGSGRIVYQTLVRIDMAIKNGSFFKNTTLLDIINKTKEKKSRLHLIGLISSGEIHSSLDHLKALIELAKQNGLEDVYLHLITDGIDGKENKEAAILIDDLNSYLSTRGIGKIASVAGRFYAMNKECNPNYLKKYFDLIGSGKGNIVAEGKIKEYLSQFYQKNFTDEFIEPAIVEYQNNQKYFIQDNDSILFFNCRPSDSSMEIFLKAFLDSDFNLFSVNNKPSSLDIATFVSYKAELDYKVAFPEEVLANTLAEVLSQNNKHQLHLAESEKALHVTYFFDGLKEKPFPGEYWTIVPSLPTVQRSKHLEMMAPILTERVVQAMEENIYDFIVVNYANPDLIAHSGDIEAAQQVVKIIDEEVHKIIEPALKQNYFVLITSDHGNIERMRNPYTGAIELTHNTNLVPLYLIANRWHYATPFIASQIEQREKEALGLLCDLAPTILEILNIAKPPEMTGNSLLKLLNLS